MNPTLSSSPPKRKRSLAALIEMRIVQVDRRIDQMDKQIADTRLEMREQFALAEKRTDSLRQEMNQQFIAVRQEMRDLFALAEKRTDELRQEMRDLFVRVDAKLDKVDTKIDKTGSDLGEKIDRSRSDMAARLSWQTNFLGVMIVILSLVIAVALAIASWMQVGDRSSFRQDDNPRNRLENPASIEQRDTSTSADISRARFASAVVPVIVGLLVTLMGCFVCIMGMPQTF